MPEVNTSGMIYCPHCLTYYGNKELHICTSSVSTNWVRCFKCNMWYNVNFEHTCPSKETEMELLMDIINKLNEIIGLLKDK